MKFKKPNFWDQNKSIFSYFFYPLTIITQIINFLKKKNKKIKKNIKTICVGNIYVGGTGKTQLSIKINNLLKSKYKTVLIKKKYSDQEDEQKLLGLNGNLICEKNRIDALEIAEKKGFQVAILDDGLQDKKIGYDLSFVCFNYQLGIGNGMLLPAGPLRENLKNLKNYEAVFLNGNVKNENLINLIKKINHSIKIFDGKYFLSNNEKFDKNKKYLAFTGIGNPKSFENTLNEYKFKILEKIYYPDHYNYTNKDIIEIKRKAKNYGLSIITTEKDYLRLNDDNKKDIDFLKIDLKINDEEKFIDYLYNSL